MIAPQELLTAKIMTLVPQDLTPPAIMTPIRRVLEVPQEGSQLVHLTRSLRPTSPAPGHPAPTVDDRGLLVLIAGDGHPAMKGVALTVEDHPVPMVEGGPAVLSQANGL